jgi:ATP dependent DNA ligase domain
MTTTRFTLPEPVAPMLASAGEPPFGPGWAFESKWDGVRIITAAANEQVRLHSRNGNEITGGYPERAVLSGLVGARLSTPMVTTRWAPGVITRVSRWRFGCGQSASSNTAVDHISVLGEAAHIPCRHRRDVLVTAEVNERHLRRILTVRFEYCCRLGGSFAVAG